MEPQVKFEKENAAAGEKRGICNFKPSQKDFVGGGKVVRESRLEGKAKKVDEKYGNLDPDQVESGKISVHLRTNQIITDAHLRMHGV